MKFIDRGKGRGLPALREVVSQSIIKYPGQKTGTKTKTARGQKLALSRFIFNGRKAAACRVDGECPMTLHPRDWPMC